MSVLRWTYSRDDEELRCELALTPDAAAYQLQFAPSGNPLGLGTERFDDAMAAFDRLTAVERSLVEAGWSLQMFEHQPSSESTASRS